MIMTMKLNRIILPAVLSALAVNYTACSDTDSLSQHPAAQQQASGQLVKLSLHLNGDSATRGTDGGFVNGTDKESHIKQLVITFYDKQGKYLSCSTLNEEEISDGLLIVSTKTDVQPARLLAWANLENTATTMSGLSLEQALTKTTDNQVTGVDDYFIMTSSSYMKDGSIVYGSALSSENIAYSQDDIIEASAVDVYLERLAAKVTLNKDNEIKVDLPTYHNEGVSFELKGMALNGTNKTSYLVKHIEDYGFTLSQWTSAWNAPDLHRSYWATDPNYVEAGSNLESYDYRTYNEIAHNTSLSEYCIENTSGAKELNIQNATHVLLVGQYTLEGVRKGANLYLYNGKLMTAGNYKELVRIKYPYYTKSGNNQYVALDNTHYIITRNGKMGKDAANVKITLKVDEGTEIFKPEAGSYASITLAQANEELGNEPDGIKYGQGKCYYAAPIHHLGLEGQVGQYGVVRNHIYQITIDQIKNFGSGIWNPGKDPDEEPTDPDVKPIDPGTDPDDPDDPYNDDPENPGDHPGEPIIPEPQKPVTSYLVSLQVKVLDWQVFEQFIDL